VSNPRCAFGIAITILTGSSDAAPKREVDYSKVDYSGVKWDEIDWSSVFDLSNKKAPAATPAPAVAEVQEAAPSVTPSPAAPAYTPEASSTKEEAPKETESKKTNPIGDAIGDFLEGLTDGIEDFCKEKGISTPGKNDKSPNGGIWLGPSEWMANFHNAGSEDVWLTCWLENSFTGMTINVNQPAILVKIPVGGNQTVSFAPKKAAACAPMYPDTPLANFGGVFNPWFEANFGPSDGSFVGTFDVSKNTRMNGDSIEAVGSKCTSNMNTCCFECQDKSAESCEKGYELVNCNAGNGGGGGYDAVMQGVGGGCNMGASSESIDVTFKNKGS
jgi:hypothetical protein